MTDDDWLLIGRINAAHGIRGWVKVYSYTDPMEQIIDYSPWTLRRRQRGDGSGDSAKEIEVVDGRRQGKGIAVRLAGFENRNEAETLIGSEIWVSGDRLTPLAPGEYYWHQLEGLTVVNRQGARLGKVESLMETGGHDVIEILPTAESIDDQARLIPYVPDQTVIEVDLDNGQLLVDWDVDY